MDVFPDPAKFPALYDQQSALRNPDEELQMLRTSVGALCDRILGICNTGRMTPLTKIEEIRHTIREYPRS